ncbi:MAG: hypothetical protein IJJ60_12795, partial [Clostridia bacterium]|nr:hypothetical protein [Clostridia bacterium]
PASAENRPKGRFSGRFGPKERFPPSAASMVAALLHGEIAPFRLISPPMIFPPQAVIGDSSPSEKTEKERKKRRAWFRYRAFLNVSQKGPPGETLAFFPFCSIIRMKRNQKTAGSYPAREVC